MSAPEFHLQKSICQALAFAYPDVWFTAVPNGAALCATNDPEGRKRAIREVSKLKLTGMKNGTPDLLLVWEMGQLGWLELKAPKGTLSPEQKSVHATLLAKGHRVSVCRSVDDLHRTLAEWNVPTRLSVVR